MYTIYIILAWEHPVCVCVVVWLCVERWSLQTPPRLSSNSDQMFHTCVFMAIHVIYSYMAICVFTFLNFKAFFARIKAHGIHLEHEIAQLLPKCLRLLGMLSPRSPEPFLGAQLYIISGNLGKAGERCSPSSDGRGALRSSAPPPKAGKK